MQMQLSAMTNSRVIKYPYVRDLWKWCLLLHMNGELLWETVHAGLNAMDQSSRIFEQLVNRSVLQVQLLNSSRPRFVLGDVERSSHASMENLFKQQSPDQW